MTIYQTFISTKSFETEEVQGFSKNHDWLYFSFDVYHLKLSQLQYRTILTNDIYHELILFISNKHTFGVDHLISSRLRRENNFVFNEIRKLMDQHDSFKELVEANII